MTWASDIADATALLDEAEVRRGIERHAYVVAAARLIVDAGGAEPRDRTARARWVRAVNHAERRIAVYGCCCGCLAMESR